MKRAGLALLLVVLAGALRAASAEEIVTVRMMHSKYMQFEPVVLFVTVKNITDDMIIFSDQKTGGDATLDFMIERGPVEWVRRRAEGGMTGKVRILPGGQREVMIELSRWYDVMQEGTFMLKAVVSYGGDRFESAPVRFEITNGLPLEKLTRMAPGGGRARTYSLRYLSRERSERLFLRIDEAESGDNFGSFDLGPLMRVRKPDLTVDGSGVITVTHQSGIDRVTRSVFKTEGEVVEFAGQTYQNEKGQALSKESEHTKKNSD